MFVFLFNASGGFDCLNESISSCVEDRSALSTLYFSNSSTLITVSGIVFTFRHKKKKRHASRRRYDVEGAEPDDVEMNAMFGPSNAQYKHIQPVLVREQHAKVIVTCVSRCKNVCTCILDKVMQTHQSVFT